jgi:hypothetical protein
MPAGRTPVADQLVVRRVPVQIDGGRSAVLATVTTANMHYLGRDVGRRRIPARIRLSDNAS